MSQIPETPMSSSEIYQKIHSGIGTSSLEESSEAALVLVERTMDRLSKTALLKEKIADFWRGKAASTATERFSQFIDTAYTDASQTVSASNAIKNQVDAFAKVYSRVVFVDQQRPEINYDDINDLIINGRSFDQKLRDWQTKNYNNIQAFADYHTASVDNANSLPTEFQSLSVEENPAAPVSVPHESSSAGRGPTSVSIAGYPANKNGSPSPVISGQQESVLAMDHSTVDTTHTAGAASSVVGPTNPWGNSASDAAVWAASGEHPSGVNPFLLDGGGGGSHGGVAGGGSGGAANGEPLLGGKTNAPGRSTGIGAPGVSSSSFKEGLAASPPAKPGGSGIPLGGVPGASSKEEDSEHQRAPFLQEADPDDLFLGGLERTTAPVIGETRQSHQ
jgi:hypothetical protein